MSKTEKAITLSVLVFPGSGHLLLGRYYLGTLLLVIAAAASSCLINGMIDQALVLAEQINRGQIQPELSEIIGTLTRQSKTGDAAFMHYVTTLLLITWLVGITDILRITRGADKDRKVRFKGAG